MSKKDEYNKAVWIFCRSCGCEYIEEKEWITNDGFVECPVCNHRLETSV